jgi:hypothetical protein
MGRGPQSEDKVCPKCGSFYINFCVHCVKTGMEERVWELLNRFELNEETLIRILAEQVKDGKFPALNLAIALREMKPAERHEVNLEEGKKISEARDRIHNLLAKLAGRRKPEPSTE